MLGGCYIFNFYFISPSVPRSLVKMSINQLIKNEKPNGCTVKMKIHYDQYPLSFKHFHVCN